MRQYHLRLSVETTSLHSAVRLDVRYRAETPPGTHNHLYAYLRGRWVGMPSAAVNKPGALEIIMDS